MNRTTAAALLAIPLLGHGTATSLAAQNVVLDFDPVPLSTVYEFDLQYSSPQSSRSRWGMLAAYVSVAKDSTKHLNTIIPIAVPAVEEQDVAPSAYKSQLDRHCAEDRDVEVLGTSYNIPWQSIDAILEQVSDEWQTNHSKFAKPFTAVAGQNFEALKWPNHSSAWGSIPTSMNPNWGRMPSGQTGPSYQFNQEDLVRGILAQQGALFTEATTVPPSDPAITELIKLMIAEGADFDLYVVAIGLEAPPEQPNAITRPIVTISKQTKIRIQLADSTPDTGEIPHFRLPLADVYLYPGQPTHEITIKLAGVLTSTAQIAQMQFIFMGPDPNVPLTAQPYFTSGLVQGTTDPIDGSYLSCIIPSAAVSGVAGILDGATNLPVLLDAPPLAGTTAPRSAPNFEFWAIFPPPL